MQIADDFIENVVTASCKIAKHRKSNTLEAKDVQLHLGTYSNWELLVVVQSNQSLLIVEIHSVIK